MMLTNTENIPGKNYEIIGLVTGSSVYCKHFGKDLGASFKNLVGGEMKAYQELLDQSQQIAVNYMSEKAAQLGADAVVNIRFSSANITEGGAEVLASGTAVRFV
ncbi:MAG: heavy metal-binding domain-containing protein [Eubacterium sp.]|nr:heavy metal-binding domain-containing protein [Eubacterium sp.]